MHCILLVLAHYVRNHESTTTSKDAVSFTATVTTTQPIRSVTILGNFTQCVVGAALFFTTFNGAWLILLLSCE